MSQVIEELRRYLPGWKNYFRLAQEQVFGKLDSWIRHRVRMVQLKQWKHGPTIYRELRALGISELKARGIAAHGRSWWKTSQHSGINFALRTSVLTAAGLPRLVT